MKTKTELTNEMRDARRIAGRGQVQTVASAWETRCKRNENQDVGDELARFSGAKRMDHRREKCARKYAEEIRRRGGEVCIDPREAASKTVDLRIVDYDRQTGIRLLKAEGWREYSRRFGSRRAAICYLAGIDEGEKWAARVPSTVCTVAEGLESLKSSEVLRAESEGRRVLRQGDVYIVEMARDCATRSARDLPWHHAWMPETRELVHSGGHATVHVPFHCKFIPQKMLAMGRLSAGVRRGSD